MASQSEMQKNMSSSYNIIYVNGAFEVKAKETQAITVEDMEVTYGDTDKAVGASITYPTENHGTLSYAVTSGGDTGAVQLYRV